MDDTDRKSVPLISKVEDIEMNEISYNHSDEYENEKFLSFELPKLDKGCVKYLNLDEDCDIKCKLILENLSYL